MQYDQNGGDNQDRRKQVHRDTFGQFRLREICRVLEHRYGWKCRLPDDDAGRADLAVLARHCVHHGGLGQVNGWAPWLTPEEAKAMIRTATAAFPWVTADQLAHALGVDRALRERLQLKTIGAIDYPKRYRVADAKDRDRIRKERDRRNGGAKPRAEYLAGSKTRTRPWEAMGLSRATWYRVRQVRPRYRKTR